MTSSERDLCCAAGKGTVWLRSRDRIKAYVDAMTEKMGQTNTSTRTTPTTNVTAAPAAPQT